MGNALKLINTQSVWSGLWERSMCRFDFGKLRLSSLQGCPTCTKIYNFLVQTTSNRNVVRFWIGSLQDDLGPFSDSSHPSCESLDWLNVRLGSGLESFDLYYAPQHTRLQLPPSSIQQLHPAIRVGRHCVGTTRDALEMAGIWFRRCITHHAKICNASDPGFLPTRLIFIGDPNSQSVSLVEHLSAPQKYAALSHRWSEQTKDARLLQSNLRQRLDSGIELSALPLLFRDVIHVLRKLGLAYLWIDCLCIVQDSDNGDDWRQEAALMGAVYRNATLTIAAASCQDSGQSLFTGPRNSVQVLQKDEMAVFIRRAIKHFSRDVGTPSEYDGIRWPLFERGWVYQERVLSPRILHFTMDEIVWECNQITTCECSVHDFNLPTRFVAGQSNRLIAATPDIDPETLARAHSVQKGRIAAEQSNVRQDWTDVVKKYSCRKFTIDGDRLPALASIARAFGEPRGWTYLCGIWREIFDSTFDWRVDVERCALKPRVKGPFPTWSWGAVGNAVGFMSQRNRVQLDHPMVALVKTIEIDHRGDVYMGEVKSAKITLTGATFTAILSHRAMDNDIHKSYVLCKGSFCTRIQADYQLDHRDENCVEDGAEVTCLVVRTLPRGRYRIVQSVLVLYRTGPTEDHRRIGYAEWLSRKVESSLTENQEVTLI